MEVSHGTGTTSGRNVTHDATVRIDRSWPPREQARRIGQALNAGSVVDNVEIARGLELRWDSPPGPQNIYPNEHIVQPLVFGRHLYGYTVPAWTGSHPAPSDKHDVFIQLLRTILPLEPLQRHGEPVSASTVQSISLTLVPNHPVQGRMPFAMIHADRPMTGGASGVRVAGLIRDNQG
jgi:hypothetical protein